MHGMQRVLCAGRQAQKEAFEAKHEWIDNMMCKKGVSDAELSRMRKKGWDKLLKTCQSRVGHAP